MYRFEVCDIKLQLFGEPYFNIYILLRFLFFQYYKWASLVAQLVKNPPAMQETWIRSLGWEDPLEKGKATHSSILAWRIPCTVYSMGSLRVHMTERLPLSLFPKQTNKHVILSQGS